MVLQTVLPTLLLVNNFLLLKLLMLKEIQQGHIIVDAVTGLPANEPCSC